MQTCNECLKRWKYRNIALVIGTLVVFVVVWFLVKVPIAKKVIVWLMTSILFISCYMALDFVGTCHVFFSKDFKIKMAFFPDFLREMLSISLFYFCLAYLAFTSRSHILKIVFGIVLVLFISSSITNVLALKVLATKKQKEEWQNSNKG